MTVTPDSQAPPPGDDRPVRRLYRLRLSLRAEGPALRWGVGVGASVLAVVTGTVVGVQWIATQVIKETLHEDLLAMVAMMRTSIDPEIHARLTDPSQHGSEAYRRVYEPMRRLLLAAPQFKYAYTMRATPEGLLFIVDAAEPGDADGDGVDDQARLGDPYPEPDPAMLVCLETRGPAVSPRPNTDAWGTFFSGFLPIVRADGTIDGLVGIDYEADTYFARIARIRRVSTIAGAGGAGASVVLGAGAWAARRRRAVMDGRLAEALSLAQEASRSKSAFLANMSHEIRTPMTAIIGFADLLEEDAELAGDPGRRSAAISTIRTNAAHLLQVLNDILDMSKVEAGRLEVERIEVDPLALVEQVAALMRPRAESLGLSMTVVQRTPLPEVVRTDPTRLRQILLNLVGNALKFTEAGSIVIAVGCAVRAGRLDIRVEDTGIGMTADQQATIRRFDSFTQADVSMTRRFGGTGLGLRVSHQLARLLGGDLSVTSEPGRGSVFTVTIDTGDLQGIVMRSPDADPTAPANPPTLPHAATAAGGQRDAAALPLAGLRILLAEDGPDNQRLFRHVLGRAGALVTVAGNGRLAIEAIEAIDAQGDAGFDLVLMDMQMPELDGYDATRRLRAGGWRRPIIAVTAHAMQGDRERCERAGCDDFLTKPIDRAALIAACRRWADAGEDTERLSGRHAAA